MRSTAITEGRRPMVRRSRHRQGARSFRLRCLGESTLATKNEYKDRQNYRGGTRTIRLSQSRDAKISEFNNRSYADPAIVTI